MPLPEPPANNRPTVQWQVAVDAFMLVELADMALPLASQDRGSLDAYERLACCGLTEPAHDPISGRMGWQVTNNGRPVAERPSGIAAAAFKNVLGIRGC